MVGCRNDSDASHAAVQTGSVRGRDVGEGSCVGGFLVISGTCGGDYSSMNVLMGADSGCHIVSRIEGAAGGVGTCVEWSISSVVVSDADQVISRSDINSASMAASRNQIVAAGVGSVGYTLCIGSVVVHVDIVVCTNMTKQGGRCIGQFDTIVIFGGDCSGAAGREGTTFRCKDQHAVAPLGM